MNPNSSVEVNNSQTNFQPGNQSESAEKVVSENVQSYLTQSGFQLNGRDYKKQDFSQNSQGVSQYNSYYQYPGGYYDPFMDVTGPFTSNFPRASDYSNVQSIVEAFPHLKDCNNPEFDIESISNDAVFYILRSSNDDNIHKAIKYRLWTSTPSGKNYLRQAWDRFVKEGKTPEIYLIFSVVSSNIFLGVAKMTSNINDSESFKYWWEPCKWFGTFQISWLFIKDIHYIKFEQIKEETTLSSKETIMTPIINLKDGTMISAKNGKQILQVFKSSSNKPNLFEYFDYMDRREDYIRTQRDNDPDFETHFKECCEAYLENPDMNFPQRKSHYNKRNSRRNYYNNGYSNGNTSYNGNGKKYTNGNGNRENGTYRHNSYKNESKGDTIADNFIIFTEADKLNKKHKSPKKPKKTGLDPQSANFLEDGKKYLGNFIQTKEEEEENEEDNSENTSQ